MISINENNKEKCCGCTACANICPKSAITMEEDFEGFLYPKIDKEKCVNCGLCNNVCPVLNKVSGNDFTIKGCIGRNKDETILKMSTSGGVASAILKVLFNKGYIAYGAMYNDNFEVVHEKALNIDEGKKFIGSKFVQSKLDNTFSKIQKLLLQKEKVCFVGTPCQVQGLKKYLKKEYENLFCIDFVCRGVPSPKVFKSYKEIMESKYKSKIAKISFRNKTYGYHSSTMAITFENGKRYFGSGRVDLMMKAFVSEICSRPSCHYCAFKSEKHVSDLTLFDCKGYSKIMQKNDDDKGYTAIIVQSERGEHILDLVKEFCNIERADLSKMIKIDGIMVNNSIKPNVNRNSFFSQFRKNGLVEAIDKTLPITKKDIVIEKVKKYLYKTHLIKIAQKLKKENMKIQK